ncbi:hypothetical protein BU24DRAFT_73816 [Aaosphaeria arxii CBS 175.79]|uniref:RING-type domain-containing protein n=1 Tax=Aaosphaeria arxii CBS 175.79 TaxID=1450172 RepID=A0A6A5X9D2_9PLEO|nr:uncharacterized protein BU24DRAFT_73816 [Aaosphaeria arxii CBS 175.79]KAF2009354.1 hypothetical protein BU24DRAFT_73816 [Aaosphaeria arxii CBS 175.79]
MATLNFADPVIAQPRSQMTKKAKVILGIVIGCCIFFFFLIILSCCIMDRKRPNVVENIPKRSDCINQRLPPMLFKEWHKLGEADPLNQQQVSKAEHVCVICLEVLEEQDSIRVLNCQHIYHRQCFDQWFTTTLHDFCPLCHQPVLPRESNTIAQGC